MCRLSMGSLGFLFILLLSVFMNPSVAKAVEIPFDPFFWLEDVEGEKSLEWVREQNQKSVKQFEAHPDFQALLRESREIHFAKDRVSFASRHHGEFWDFWQDATHKHGVIRKTSLEEYRKAEPQWDVVLDLDALSAAENENWVYKGGARLDTNSNRALIYLSRGGKDASVVREFDYVARKFVSDGFILPEAKSSITTVNENQIIVGTDFGADSLTTSGYPRILKVWNRGEHLAQARTVFEVKNTDLSAGAVVLKDGDKKHTVFYRTVDFFNSEFFLAVNGANQKLPLPTTAELLGLKNDKIYFQTKDELVIGARKIPANSILRYPMLDSGLENAELIFTAKPRQSIQGVSVHADHLLISLLDNIKSRVLELKPDANGAWAEKVLPLPATGILSFSEKDPEEAVDLTTMTYTDHLTPMSQYLVHDEDGSYRLELLKSSPARFDSSRFEVVQNFATSKDGTQIPYFVLKPKDLVLDGTHPTILYGYGGFEVSLTPSYSATIGKMWLERGGVYVIANIRGGGEFGPEWHNAALKLNRQRAYDDFIAVAEDLVAKKITSPAHLGIKGGSNGGLLIGATMVQRPDLFNAAVSQVPLLDMIRYSHLLAGASWIGEYGDPANEDECKYLLSYSPYQNVKPGVRYPTPFFYTSTKDDRVHPGHARKMAARMMEQGHPLFYYENINGGHAGSANLEESAYMAALDYTYFSLRLR